MSVQIPHGHDLKTIKEFAFSPVGKLSNDKKFSFKAANQTDLEIGLIHEISTSGKFERQH